MFIRFGLNNLAALMLATSRYNLEFILVHVDPNPNDKCKRKSKCIVSKYKIHISPILCSILMWLEFFHLLKLMLRLILFNVVFASFLEIFRQNNVSIFSHSMHPSLEQININEIHNYGREI